MIYEIEPQALTILILLAIWETLWKGFALWKSAKKNQLGWFLVILILNTAGILPILYLNFFGEKQKPSKSKKNKK